MEYNKLVQLVGEGWADFLKPFMCPDADGKCRYDEISQFLQTQYKGGKKIFPAMGQVFRAFQETPFEKVRVIILGTEPYNRPGYANGLAHATDNPNIPISLQCIYKAVERDVYNQIDWTNPRRTGIPGKPYQDHEGQYTWMEQGVLLLNLALTSEEGVDSAHTAIWRPFTEYILSNIWRIKRDLVVMAWGNQAKEAVHYRGDMAGTDNGSKGVNIFHAFVLEAEQPVDAAKAKREWITDNFSRCNLIIKCNTTGEPIQW